jgi:hypothetical protein
MIRFSVEYDPDTLDWAVGTDGTEGGALPDQRQLPLILATMLRDCVDRIGSSSQVEPTRIVNTVRGATEGSPTEKPDSAGQDDRGDALERALDAIYTHLCDLETLLGDSPSKEECRLLHLGIEHCKYWKQPEFSNRFGGVAADPATHRQSDTRLLKKAVRFLSERNRWRAHAGVLAENLRKVHLPKGWCPTVNCPICELLGVTPDKMEGSTEALALAAVHALDEAGHILPKNPTASDVIRGVERLASDANDAENRGNDLAMAMRALLKTSKLDIDGMTWGCTLCHTAGHKDGCELVTAHTALTTYESLCNENGGDGDGDEGGEGVSECSGLDACPSCGYANWMQLLAGGRWCDENGVCRSCYTGYKGSAK